MSNNAGAAVGGIAVMALIAALKIGFMKGCDSAVTGVAKVGGDVATSFASQADTLGGSLGRRAWDVSPLPDAPQFFHAPPVGGPEEFGEGMEFAKRMLGAEQQREFPLNEVIRGIGQTPGTEQPWREATELGQPAAATEQWRSLGHIKARHLRPDALPPRSFKSMRMIGILPKGDGYRNVFRHAATAAMADQVATAERKLADLGHLTVISESHHNARMIYDQMAQGSPDELVVVVGHSEKNGEWLMLPDNTYVEVKKLHYAAALMKRRCLVVTCHSPDLRLTGEIALKEAVQMCMAARGVFDEAGLDPVALSAISDRMRQELQAGRVKNAALTGMVWVSGGGGGLYLVQVQAGRSNTPQATPPPNNNAPTPVARG